MSLQFKKMTIKKGNLGNKTQSQRKIEANYVSGKKKKEKKSGFSNIDCFHSTV